jgi:hypothetical protein
VAECRSAGVPECRSAGVPECGSDRVLGCLSGTAGRPASNSPTCRVCRCWCRGSPLSAAAAQRSRWVQSAGVTELQSAGVRETGCWGAGLGVLLPGSSLLVSREPAVGGSGATGPVGTECRSDRVPECGSGRVAGCRGGGPGCWFGVPVGNGRPFRDSEVLVPWRSAGPVAPEPRGPASAPSGVREGGKPP